MAQGAYINMQRPKHKKQLKEAVASNPASVSIERTSPWDAFGGVLTEAPPGSYYIVGPDPQTKRSWFAQIVVSEEGIKVA